MNASISMASEIYKMNMKYALRRNFARKKNTNRKTRRILVARSASLLPMAMLFNSMRWRGFIYSLHFAGIRNEPIVSVIQQIYNISYITVRLCWLLSDCCHCWLHNGSTLFKRNSQWGSIFVGIRCSIDFSKNGQ